METWHIWKLIKVWKDWPVSVFSYHFYDSFRRYNTHTIVVILLRCTVYWFYHIHRVLQPSLPSDFRTFSSPPKRTPISLSSHSPFLGRSVHTHTHTILRFLVSTNTHSVSIDLPILHILYKGNHEIRGHL